MDAHAADAVGQSGAVLADYPVFAEFLEKLIHFSQHQGLICHYFTIFPLQTNLDMNEQLRHDILAQCQQGEGTWVEFKSAQRKTATGKSCNRLNKLKKVPYKVSYKVPY
jgi:hypothetical protein